VADWHRYSVAPPSTTCRVPRVLFLAWIGVKDAEEEARSLRVDRAFYSSSWQKKVSLDKVYLLYVSTPNKQTAVIIHFENIVSQRLEL
jgi:hypothetical protein